MMNGARLMVMEEQADAAREILRTSADEKNEWGEGTAQRIMVVARGGRPAPIRVGRGRVVPAGEP